jgi:hypothetical protein
VPPSSPAPNAATIDGRWVPTFGGGHHAGRHSRHIDQVAGRTLPPVNITYALPRLDVAPGPTGVSLTPAMVVLGLVCLGFLVAVAVVAVIIVVVVRGRRSAR